MPEPTLYFPQNVYYKLGFQEGRQWNTLVLDGPTGRRQAAKQQIRPKRKMTATVYPTTQVGVIHNLPGYGNNDPGSAPPKLTDEDIWGLDFVPFLNNIAGRFNPFYIFNPKARFFYQLLVGGWNGGGLPLPITFPDFMPFTFPFRGEYGLAAPQVPNIIGLQFAPVGGGVGLEFEAEDFTITAGPLFGATQLSAFAPPARTPPGAGDYYLYVTVAGAHERIPAVMTSDLDDFQFDWTGADPPNELVFDLVEDFG